MPVSRRCSRAVIALAQKYVPDILAKPDAPLGVVETAVPFAAMLERWMPGDAVLCRNNRPLIALKYHCLKNGIPAYFRGGAKESGFLLWFVKLFAEKLGPATDDVVIMLDRAKSWLDRRAGGSGNAEYQQRIEAIETIGERVYGVRQLKSEIKTIFAEPKSGEKYIELSTVHLSKGDEWKTVFLICGDLITKAFAKAKTEEAKAQEFNARYVAITRAQLNYYETTGFLTKAA